MDISQSNVPAPASDGEEIVAFDSMWTSCCGAWWSRTGWGKSQIFKSAPDGTCGRCKKVLLRAKSDVPTIEAYRHRLHDTQLGFWGPRFQPTTVEAGETKSIYANVYRPFLVTHVGIPSHISDKFRIQAMTIGTKICIDGPLPAELFAVRVPTDMQRPIDRGGSIEPIVAFPGLSPVIQVINRTDTVLEFEAGLFGANQDGIEMKCEG